MKISICVIMKNEEKRLETFLNAIEKNILSDYELVMVDTGSTDKSKEIALKHNAKVYDFAWCDDFSAARNFSISKATNQWILVLDCDENVTECDPTGFDRMAQQDAEAIGIITRNNNYEKDGIQSCYTDGVERFFNKNTYHYEYMIHEQVRKLNGNQDIKRIRIPVTVDHSGYDGSADALKEKAERNRRLLLLMLEKSPEDPYLYFQLGQCYQAENKSEEAAYYFGKGLSYDIDPKAKYAQLMVVGYGYALLDTGREEEVLDFESLIDAFGDYADFMTLMGMTYLRNGCVPQAIEAFEKAMTLTEVDIQGANSFIPGYNLGCMYEVMGDIERAKDYFTKCGDFEPAAKRLEELNK